MAGLGRHSCLSTMATTVGSLLRLENEQRSEADRRARAAEEYLVRARPSLIRAAGADVTARLSEQARASAEYHRLVEEGVACIRQAADHRYARMLLESQAEAGVSP